MTDVFHLSFNTVEKQPVETHPKRTREVTQSCVQHFTGKSAVEIMRPKSFGFGLPSNGQTFTRGVWTHTSHFPAHLQCPVRHFPTHLCYQPRPPAPAASPHLSTQCRTMAVNSAMVVNRSMVVSIRKQTLVSCLAFFQVFRRPAHRETSSADALMAHFFFSQNSDQIRSDHRETL
eukprot:COSAG01_NODE_3358_length_6204_cov_363.490254_5_plen_175_part_00